MRSPSGPSSNDSMKVLRQGLIRAFGNPPFFMISSFLPSSISRSVESVRLGERLPGAEQQHQKDYELHSHPCSTIPARRGGYGNSGRSPQLKTGNMINHRSQLLHPLGVSSELGRGVTADTTTCGIMFKTRNSTPLSVNNLLNDQIRLARDRCVRALEKIEPRGADHDYTPESAKDAGCRGWFTDGFRRWGA